ncbi:MAG: sulfatase [Saprospiraceae bacterium]
MTIKILFQQTKTRQFIIVSLAISCFFLFQCTPTTSKIVKPPNLTQPNIVLFYADDLGWMDLAIQGSTYYETPNIDRIAKEGMRFTNAYANAANCAPSRACLMTGLYPPRHGIYTVGNAARGKAKNRKITPVTNKTVLDSSLLTLPTFLQNKGYQTAIAGKWHLSKDPIPYGFDANFGGFKAGHPKSYFSPYKNPNLTDGPEGEHLTDRLATDLSNWIKQQQNKPFFAYFPFYSVHTPIQARPDLIEKYQNKSPAQYHNKPEYAAMIEAMDLAVGKILQTIDEMGESDNTIIIFTADNGAHGGQTLSRPLRGAKGMYYEGGIREPLMIKWTGKIKPNSSNETPVIGNDLFPTIADILNDKSVQTGLDGISILPLLEGQAIKERALYWHFPAYLEMYKKDRAFEDSHGKPHFRTTPVSVIRVGDWKLLEYFENEELELYNLAKDIGEQNNLASSEVVKAKELYQQLKDWQIQTNAFIPE